MNNIKHMSVSLRLSVHQLVDFLLRNGDIDDRVYNRSTMAEGTRLHTLYQTSQVGDYLSEYYLEETFKVKDYDVTLNGRADGIIIIGNTIVVDEIKTTIMDLDEFFNEEKEWHLGQAKCYALMIAHLKNAETVKVKLTYIHQIDRTKKVHDFTFKVKDLEKEIKDYIKEYLEFYEIIQNHKISRNNYLKDLSFPFTKFRKGQRELAKYCFGIAKNGGILFAEAPTGIGKTMSTIFPFIKSFSDTDNEKIFYLTAKNQGKEAALQALRLINEDNSIISAISILAKDKICFNPDKGCNPDECPFAKSYYKKVRDALIKALTEKDQIFTNIDIASIAKEYDICPFEFSLDLSLFLDFIICDYNYFFDPMVYFKRYFDDDSSKYLALIDEAHNLVERGRNMYSASISSVSFKKSKDCLKILDHKKIKSTSKRITKMFNSFKEYEDGEYLLEEGLDVTWLNAMENYLLASSDVLKNHHAFINEDFKDFHFEVNKFMKLMEYYSSDFAIYINKYNKDIKINLFCLNPAENLKNSFNRIKGSVIFSATLSPVKYYMEMLLGKDDYPFLKLSSPFKQENLLLMVAPHISTRYKDRDITINEIFLLIKEVVTKKIANYFIYVPSYNYLDKLVPFLETLDIELLVQERDMTTEEKDLFTSLFKSNPTKSRLGLAVIGGGFSEGIDLISDRLYGVIIVGVGLPQLCFERDLIRDYFDKLLINDNDEDKPRGYQYAYLFPGMNKVMQAVGRVIRSESDRGLALLIDDRYLSKQYRDLYKDEWSHYKVISSIEDVSKEIERFEGKKK